MSSGNATNRSRFSRLRSITTALRPAVPEFGDDPVHIAGRLDGTAVHRQQDIALLHALAGRRAAGRHIRDHDLAVRLAEIEPGEAARRGAGFCDPLACRHRGKRHLGARFCAVPPQLERHRLARVPFGDHARQAAHFADALAVHLQNHVAGLDARACRRPGGIDRRHQRAFGLVEAEARRQVVADMLDAHAEPPALDRAAHLQLRHDIARKRGRNGEADADAAAVRREDRRVHADDLALEIEGRAAGIAAVDRGRDLEEVVIGARPDLAPARRDDAGRGGMAEAEGVAHRHHPVAHPHLFGVGKRDMGKRLLRLHLEECQVRLRVRADEARGQLALVVEDDGDLLRTRHDMVVGDDMAVRRDDEAGADPRYRLPVAPFFGPGRAVAEETAHELLRAGRHVRLDALLDADVHHGRRYSLDGPGQARQRGGGGIGRPGGLERAHMERAARRKRPAEQDRGDRAPGRPANEQSGLHEVFPSADGAAQAAFGRR